MALSKRKSTVSVLRGILGPVSGNLTHFARLAGRKEDWVKKVSAGQITLTEEAALRLASETGIALKWLLDGDPSSPPVGTHGNPYTKDTFQLHRSRATKGTIPMSAAARIHNIMLEVLTIADSSRRRGREELFFWKLNQALGELREEFRPALSPDALATMKFTDPEFLEILQWGIPETPEEMKSAGDESGNQCGVEIAEHEDGVRVSMRPNITPSTPANPAT